MNKVFIKLLTFCLLCIVSFTSCERYPINSLLGLPDPIDSWPNPWYIYDDKINTKGSMEPFRWQDDPTCADWNKVSLSFACTDAPQSGTKCISFSWVGNANDTSKSFFGFGLQAREKLSEKVDLSSSGYTNLRFWVKGKLYNNCSFEIGIPDTSTSITINASQISPYWEEYIIPMNNIGEITFDLSMSLKSSGLTNGGTVYIDNIRFTKD